MLDEIDTLSEAISPRRTASLSLKLAFAILTIPIVVGAWHMAKAIMHASETVGMTKEQKEAKAVQLQKQVEILDKEIAALQVALADRRKVGWIFKDNEGIAKLSQQISSKIEEQNELLAQIYDLLPDVAPVGS